MVNKGQKGNIFTPSLLIALFAGVDLFVFLK